MSFDLQSLSMFFLVGAFWLLVVPLLSKNKNSHRSVLTIFTAGIGLVYLIWRFVVTVSPFSGPLFNEFWAYLVFIVEVFGFIEISIFLLIMSKTNKRSAEADVYETKLDRIKLPPVDVFIPTYNEGLDVLEKTIIGAKHLDYPDFTIWVLDDGKRDWLKEFCESHNVNYLIRSENAHAKAGNLNNGLQCANGELFAIFDADFIPARKFLRRTVGFFIFNEDIGIVQTPQHFYNKDPIQSNLYIDKVWPDEQRLFFDAMAPCRDGWNAAFCCGSCSIIRRKAIDEIGGIPTSSITEDLLTTLCLLTKNYRTVYLGEKLSQGMAADSVKGYFIQRARWCRGGIQCFFVPEGPIRAKGLSIFQRILFAPYGWLIQPITRIMVLIVPIIYLWLGIQPLHFTTTAGLLVFQFPMLLCYTLTMQWLAPKKYIPLLSTSVGVFGMFRLLPVVISSVIKPFGEPFRVTPKGSGSSSSIDWYILTVSIILILATVFGIVLNIIPEYRMLTSMEFFPYALMWSVVNLFILFICALLCFDTPRKRKEERFIINEPALLKEKHVILKDISITGCKIKYDGGEIPFKLGQEIILAIKDIEKLVSVRIISIDNNFISGEFVNVTAKTREDLIVKIFTGNYDNEIRERRSLREIINNLFDRAFGEELK